MAKITQYPAKTVPSNNDEFVFHEPASGSTKKMTRGDLIGGAPLPSDSVDEQAIANGAVTSSKLNLTTSVDANGWTVYNFGTAKHYAKVFTAPAQNIIIGGGLLTLTGNNIPSGMTNLGSAKSIQYSIRFNADSPFVISNLDGAATGTTIRIGVSRPSGPKSLSGSVYVSIWV